MDRIRIVGGQRLNGTIPISGAKNATLPILAGAEGLSACPIAVFSKVYQELKLDFKAAADLTAEAGLDGIDCPVRSGGEIEPEQAANWARYWRDVIRFHAKERHEHSGEPFRWTRDASYVALPGMLYGKIFRSTVAHGKIKSIDTSAARARPAVSVAATRFGVSVRSVAPGLADDSTVTVCVPAATTWYGATPGETNQWPGRPGSWRTCGVRSPKRPPRRRTTALPCGASASTSMRSTRRATG